MERMEWYRKKEKEDRESGNGKEGRRRTGAKERERGKEDRGREAWKPHNPPLPMVEVAHGDNEPEKRGRKT